MNTEELKLPVHTKVGSKDFVICDAISTFTILDWEYSNTGYLVLHEGKKKAVVVEWQSGKMFFISLEELQELVVTYKTVLASTENLIEQLKND